MEYKKFKLSGLKETNEYINDFLIIIRTPPFIPHMFLPFILFIAIIWTIVSDPRTVYIFPLILFFALVTYQIWQLFEPVKIIIVDKTNKSFIVIYRNPIKNLFTKNIVLLFNDVKMFLVSEGPEIILEKPRFIISAILKDSTSISFFQTTKKPVAEKVLDFLNNTLHTH